MVIDLNSKIAKVTKKDTGLIFDRSNDYLLSEIWSGIDWRTAYTIFVKMIPVADSNDSRVFFSTRPDLNERIEMGFFNQGIWQVRVGGQSGNREQMRFNGLNLNQVNTLQFSHDGGTTKNFKMYHDGQQVNFSIAQGSLDYTVSTIYTDPRIIIGSQTPTQGFFEGSLFEISIVDYEKTATEALRDVSNGFQSKGSGNFIFNANLNLGRGIKSLNPLNGIETIDNNKYQLDILGKPNPMIIGTDIQL